MMGATGAVGNHCALKLSQMEDVNQLTLLGRRTADNITGDSVKQNSIDISNPDSYAEHLKGHNIAICTLGVGEPSKVSKEVFIKIDKEAVLTFATACKAAGIEHFELLSSVGVNAKSKSFYLRTKGELEEGLRALNFKRLSLFHPSMILTPTNRYGLTQAIALKVTPILNPLLIGSTKRYRGIPVEILGKAFAANLNESYEGVEILHWENFKKLNQ